VGPQPMQVSSLAIFFISLMLSTVLCIPSTVLSLVKANTSIGRYQNTSSFVSYQDATLGIKFQYPENWKKILHYSANNSRIEFISPLQSQFEIFPPSFGVSVSNATSNLTLDRLSKTIIEKGRQSMTDFKLLQSNITKVGGIPAQKIVYTFISPDPSLQIQFQTMDILVIKSDRIYTISYTESRAQYANYLSTIEQIVNSFEIKR
jgi:eukaryotic-like serine/threonine-protein kinase